MNNEHLHPEGRPYTKEEFVEKIKTDKKFADRFGNLGSIYGKQWRSWTKLEPNIGQSGVNKTYLFTDYNGLHTHYLTQIDQIQNLINDLKTNPDSRRLMVNSWHVGELDQMVLPPCHYGFQLYTRELTERERNSHSIACDVRGQFRTMFSEEELNEFNVPKRAISLMWNQRSVDTFLGLPFNIASYGLLLEIIAKAVNMVPDELIGNLGDTHLYSNHIEQAKEQIGRELSLEERRKLWESTGMGWKEEVSELLQMQEYNCRFIPKRTREPFQLPTIKHMKTEAFFKSLSEDISLVTHLDNTDFEIENYQSHPSIKAPLSN